MIPYSDGCQLNLSQTILVTSHFGDVKSVTGVSQFGTVIIYRHLRISVLNTNQNQCVKEDEETVWG